MKQVLLLRGGARAVRDVPSPPYAAGDVLVRNAFSVISSGTERSSGEQPHSSPLGRAVARPDLVREVVRQASLEGVRQTAQAVRRRLAETWPVGYSSAGVVVEVGAAVRGIAPGDNVACAGGGYANHAEVVVVPRNLCATVPAAVELQTAAMTTIAAVALHGVRLARVSVGDRVGVVGCGLIGQITCRLLRAAGAEVFAADIDESRVKAAAPDHGYVIGPDAAARVIADAGAIGVDHVLVTAAAPSNDPLMFAAEIARDRAELVVVGDVPVELPRSVMFAKELSLQVSRSYGPGRYDPDYEIHGVDYPPGYVRWTQQRNMECVLDLQARGVLELADLIEEVVEIDQAPAAYERLAGPAAQRPRGAIVISYPGYDAPGAPVVFADPGPAAPASADAGPSTESGSPRLGLIGPGGFANGVIIPALMAAGAELVVVGGGSGPSADAAARDFGFSRVADSAEAVCADPGIEAVAICTRHGTHAELTTRALTAGKHVFCEKPLALSLQELETVLAAARRSGRVVAVGFNRRFAPTAVRLREFLAAAGGPTTITYRVSAGSVAPGHWVNDLEQGGGRVLGEVCHFVDTLAFLAGSPVTEVHASAVSGAETPAQARDNVAITLRHADGSLSTIAYVPYSAPGVGKERVEAFYRSGVGILDDYRTLEVRGSRELTVKERGQQKGHREEIAAFLTAVRSGRPPVALDELANVTIATLAIVESIRTGSAVEVQGSGLVD